MKMSIFYMLKTVFSWAYNCVVYERFLTFQIQLELQYSNCMLHFESRKLKYVSKV